MKLIVNSVLNLETETKICNFFKYWHFYATKLRKKYQKIVLLLQQILFNLPKFLNRTSLFSISNHLFTGGRRRPNPVDLRRLHWDPLRRHLRRRSTLHLSAQSNGLLTLLYKHSTFMVFCDKSCSQKIIKFSCSHNFRKSFYTFYGFPQKISKKAPIFYII